MSDVNVECPMCKQTIPAVKGEKTAKIKTHTRYPPLDAPKGTKIEPVRCVGSGCNVMVKP